MQHQEADLAPPRLCGGPIAVRTGRESIKAYGHERITKELNSPHGHQPVIDVSLE
jgi:hypothetical protein